MYPRLLQFILNLFNIPAVTVCNNNMLRASALTSTFQSLISAAMNKTDRGSAQQELADLIGYGEF